jgi:hypothetical protein
MFAARLSVGSVSRAALRTRMRVVCAISIIQVIAYVKFVISKIHYIPQFIRVKYSVHHYRRV